MLTRSYGISGLMIASAFVDILECLYLSYFVFKNLELSIKSIFFFAVYPALKSCAFLALIPFFLFYNPLVNGWASFILSASIFFIFWLFGAILFGISNEEKEKIGFFFKFKLKSYIKI
jgi:hypothetical protein